MQTNRVATLLCLCLAVSACYSRKPLTTTPSPSSRVVATLTDSGTVAMSNALGPGAVEVEGVVTNAGASEWTLQMLRVDHRDGRSISWNHEQVSFPQRALINPQLIRLDKTKSWLVAGGIVVGAFLAARAFNVIGADEPDDNTPVPQESVIGRPRR
jgi:hypothetical protein